jgi:small Trp-rich protein
MFLVVTGVVLLAMKWMEFAPVANWPWWSVFTPFIAAVVWWAIADWSGYTARQTMKREEARKQARIDRNKENMGTLTKSRRK